MDANVEFRSKVKHKTLSGQSREIISCVLQFMQNETKKNGVPVIPLAKVQERVAAATGVSLRTVKMIAGESRKIECGVVRFYTPLKFNNPLSVVYRKFIAQIHNQGGRVPMLIKN